MEKKTPNSIVFISLLILSLFIGFISISIISYLGTKTYVTGNTINQSLPLISDNIYSEIQRELLDPINISSLMANDTFLVEWVENGEIDLDEIRHYLNRIRDRYGFTSAFLVSEKTKQYYFYEGILKQVSEADAHDIWYFHFVQSQLPFALDVDTDEARAGILTVFINHRLENGNGDFLGVTGVGLELSNIGEKFKTHQDKYDHEIYLVNRNGIIQVHSNQTYVENANLLDRYAITEIPEFSLSPENEIQVHEFIENGDSKAISLRYIPEFDWFLVVEKNQTASLHDARVSLWKNIIIGILITLFVAILLFGNFRFYYKKLELLATIDDLTQVNNRRHFTELFEREIAIAKRYNNPLSLLMMDIDNFKEINENFGHLVGDKMLCLIAENIKTSVRNSDIVGRWGGEEFVVLLINTDLEEAKQTAERIRYSIMESKLSTEFGDVRRTISVGISTLNDEISTDDAMTRIADNALYEAKRLGKNKIAF